MQGMTSWDDMRVFLAIHRRRTHASAARLLRVDATTVARRIAALEASLGTQLFTRTPAGLEPTPAALALLPHAERIEAAALEAERAVAGTDERVEGAVRITAPDGTATFLLAPGLGRLRAEHPALRVSLVADNRALDLVRGEADVAVRFFPPREKSLVIRRLGTFRFGVYGGERYLARRGRPRTVGDLRAHDWIGFGADLDGTEESAWLRRLVPRERVVITANTTLTRIAACAAGHGLMVLGSLVAARDPRLVRVLPRLTVGERGVWAVTHPDLRRSAKIAAVLRWLERLFDGASRRLEPLSAASSSEP